MMLVLLHVEFIGACLYCFLSVLVTVLILWNKLTPAPDLLYGLGCLQIPLCMISLLVSMSKLKEENFSFSFVASLNDFR